MIKRGILSVIQILILIMGIVSVSYALGSEAKIVSAGGDVDQPKEEDEEESSGIDISNIGGIWGVVGSSGILGQAGAGTKEGGQAATLTPTSSKPGILKQIYGFGEGKGVEGSEKWLLSQGNFLDGIVSSASWGLTAYGAVKLLGGLFGLDEKQTNAAAMAAGFGVFAGRAAYLLAKENGLGLGKFAESLGISPSTFGIGVGVIVAAVIFILMYKTEDTEVITLTCDPWQAPTGGEYCEECNKGILPCSEYQCRSLGQSCELLNAGTDEEKCAWVNKNDVEPPVIEPLEDALLEGYVYEPAGTISPPDRGTVIYNQNSQDGCANAFTPLSFGITLNEPSQCKVDYERKDSFEEMSYYLGGTSLFKYNHTQTMNLPGAEALKENNLTIYNDGDYRLYVRCQDSNGNTNTGNFVFKFCVEEGPDTTPPIIVGTDMLSNMPIAYNQSSTDIEVYINEPASCKWSKTDQDYDDMENSMSCSSSIMEMNAQMVYKCETTLTGINDNQENLFYFRCKDQPTKPEADRNENQESYEFNLIGTMPLYISSLEPNGTIKDSTDAVKVTLEAETGAGYNEGESICYYSDSGEENDYIQFFNTESYTHSQDLYLSEGDYEYWIKCIDLGGNYDIGMTEFDVETDISSPVIVRAYHEESYLKLITNEKAECVYDATDCNYLFDDGTTLTQGEDKKTHFTEWNTKINYYIKCRDDYGNEPLPNECSIIARPFEVNFS